MQNISTPASLDLAAQLQRLGKVRESLYSQNGWSSTNVDQSSKWDVGETIDPLAIGHTHNRRNCDTGTNIWSSEYQAQQAIYPNANCSVASGASYSGTGPMPRPLEFLYDDDELAKRSGVESILAYSEPIIDSTRQRHNNWSIDPQHTGYNNAENPNAQYMNGSGGAGGHQMNLHYQNFNAQNNSTYNGFDNMFGETSRSINRPNEIPLHLQLQGLSLAQSSNAQLPEPNINSVTAIHPSNRRLF